ncbi:hypothetical protein [Comamonas thiooxydans]|uniref:hypothetical protein n=1 Tax=Comamonas thiooxydans TaxID=363952 RepID=UPI0013D9235C|nr:hypothetical protein [Comamonas thiooxydans]
MMQMVCTQDLATGSPEEFCYLQELQNLADLHLAGIQNQAQVEMKAEAAQPIRANGLWMRASWLPTSIKRRFRPNSSGELFGVDLEALHS